MDHNLEDSLNLESAMGVDFDHSEDTVVNQADITLDGEGHEENIPMEFENIEEQPLLMDTGNEEIIVSDFMGEQFTLQEYSAREDQMINPKVEPEETILTTQPELIGLSYDSKPMSVQASGVIGDDVYSHPKIINVKANIPSMRPIAPKKEAVVLTKVMAPKNVAPAPRQVAIAPKPNYKMAVGKNFANVLHPGLGSQPKPKPAVKPVALVANKNFNQVVKKVALPASKDVSKGNTLLAIGNKYVMLPSGGGQKIKLVTSGAGVSSMRLVSSGDDQAQLTPNMPQMPKLTKVVLQGSSADTSNQSAVITKIMPQPRYITMQQKTVPISLDNSKVVMKPGVKFSTGKKQVFALTSPKKPVAVSQAPTTKKVVITANPTQNVILKSSSAPQTGNITKVTTTAPKTQLHQINVPGKGIQYIRLVTNPPPRQQVKTAAPKALATPSKSFVLTDNKGNLIQMSNEKAMTTQPPPLIVTSGSVSSVSRAPPKSLQKLVKIAPLTSKLGQAAMQNRSGQSLLAPMSPPTPPAEAQLPAAGFGEMLSEDMSTIQVSQDHDMPQVDDIVEEEVTEHIEHDEIDSKTALQALIADAVGSDAESQGEPHNTSQFDEHFDNQPEQRSSECSDSNSVERPAGEHHPLIVIPSYLKTDAIEQDVVVPDAHIPYHAEDGGNLSGMINIEVDPYNVYASDSQQVLSDSEVVSSDLASRARKACNCTKSQCLKLYCDCFASGEFCHNCNCTNCHNNLQNEELRQKAIRGCLDRNPNAFRPKIGKSRTGGPDNYRRHNKGCNCKRSGCLKNYCECYEHAASYHVTLRRLFPRGSLKKAKIACTAICKCVGCRNVEETLERARRREPTRTLPQPTPRHNLRAASLTPAKQPCSFMTTEVIEAVCQCLIAAAVESREGAGGGGAGAGADDPRDPVRDVVDEFARCLQDIISASHQATPLSMFDETPA